MDNIMERRIDNCIRARDNCKSEWGKNYWTTTLMILFRQYKSGIGIH